MGPSGNQVMNRDLLYYERYLATQRERARGLVRENIIEEHRRKPLGHHSDDLARLAFILSNGPHAGRYAVRVVELFRAYQIVRLSGSRGVPPAIVDQIRYASPEDAYHAIFLRRIADKTL